MRFASRRRVVMTVVTALGLACDHPFEFSGTLFLPVAIVVVRPDSATVTAGAALLFRAVLLDSAGDTLTDREVSWSTPDPAVAAVSFSGQVQTLAPGAARIIAESEGIRDTARLTVLPVTFAAIAAGERHTCARANNARVYCWGLGFSGQLGVGGTPFLQTTPARVAGTGSYQAVTAGANHACALTLLGSPECWGANASSQLGRGSSVGDPTRPGPVANNLEATLLTAGDLHSCALLVDSAAVCWGGDLEGQLGDSQGLARPFPTAVVGGHRWIALDAGARHSCAITPADTAWCWGANASGQLGDSTRGGNRRYPVAVVGSLAFTAIAAGEAHTCGVLVDHRVFCWGDNTRGQLGRGQADSLAVVPTEVVAGVLATAVTTGLRHSCALLQDSTAACWGANDRGQIGDNSTSDRPAPVAVAGGLRFLTLSAGAEHTCGVVVDGTAYCWGAGESGQLGDASVSDRPFPTAVINPLPLLAPRLAPTAHRDVIAP